MFLKQKKVAEFLESFFLNPEQPVQSLLFWGEEMTGKMTTAKSFSKGLLCLNSPRQWNGCGQCDSCLMVEKGLHPDLMILEPEEGSLKIGQIRKGLEFLSYRPQLSQKRILIIDKAEAMTKDAQNAFLKTLEEPPQDTLIILISSSPQLLLPTVRSRLLALRFPRASLNDIALFLQKKYSLSEAESQKIASRSQGKIGLAVRLLNNDYRAQELKMRKDLQLLLKSNFAYQSNYYTELIKTDYNFLTTLQYWLYLIEQDIINHTSNVNLTLPRKINLASNLLHAIHLLQTTNLNKQLLMENIFLPYAISSSN